MLCEPTLDMKVCQGGPCNPCQNFSKCQIGESCTRISTSPHYNMPPPKSKSKSSIPNTVSTFTILPLTLPDVKSSGQPASAPHYLYIKPHEPTQATLSAHRSLFITNIPIDANDANIKSLFVDQLGGSRVESVEFDTAVPEAPTVKRWKAENNNAGESRGKKRKRDEDIVAEGVVEDEKSALPKIWNSELRKSGSGAIVVFVDQASMKGAWKEVQRAAKNSKTITWTQGEGLGIEREHMTLKLIYCTCQLISLPRLQIPQYSSLSSKGCPTIKCQCLPDTVYAY